MVKTEFLVKKLSEKFYEEWENEIANEVAEARDAIIKVLKERKASLPGAVFALDLVKMELVRGQLEEFLGHVSLTERLPLSTTKPKETQAEK